MNDELPLSVIASLESSTHQTKQTLKKSTTVRDTVSHIHKVKQNNVSISSSMCFSASAVIDGPAINGLFLVVKAFAIFFYHLFLIHFFCREKQIVNVTTPIIVKM
jgi:hypothetical protein